MNIVTLIGRITKDPEIRYTNSQVAVCSFTLAVNRPKDKNGETKADFIRCIVFGKSAEAFAKYMAKGRQVAIEGRIQTGSYQNQKGDTVYTTDVIVNRFYFIGNSSSTSESNKSESIQPQFGIPEGFEAIDDCIPF